MLISPIPFLTRGEKLSQSDIFVHKKCKNVKIFNYSYVIHYFNYMCIFLDNIYLYYIYKEDIFISFQSVTSAIIEQI